MTDPRLVEANQVVPDFWYVVFQEEIPNSNDWRECGRLDVRTDPMDKEIIVERWFLYKDADPRGGGYIQNGPRMKFHRLGDAAEADVNAIRLQRISRDPIKEPSGDVPYTLIEAICRTTIKN